MPLIFGGCFLFCFVCLSVCFAFRRGNMTLFAGKSPSKKNIHSQGREEFRAPYAPESAKKNRMGGTILRNRWTNCQEYCCGSNDKSSIERNRKADQWYMHFPNWIKLKYLAESPQYMKSFFIWDTVNKPKENVKFCSSQIESSIHFDPNESSSIWLRAERNFKHLGTQGGCLNSNASRSIWVQAAALGAEVLEVLLVRAHYNGKVACIFKGRENVPVFSINLR